LHVFSVARGEGGQGVLSCGRLDVDDDGGLAVGVAHEGRQGSVHFGEEDIGDATSVPGGVAIEKVRTAGEGMVQSTGPRS